ncbi:hypothetical protein [Clostridium saccharobutylicum]|uniref:Prepilin-type N-terminal cleavage/methylation domain-containing protein n=1 Tax=Clostridium saccharobutylicum DSM 13864 TaxID=1345695 RepID=U5MW54_CLOSA|nr:hypothetical protein [Clostridium saccharobutylicum]AGX43677.1 hypothetical protein CLSA_c27060 [Clostridium saccharobutylicum DSM 13864]AQR90975.1 hypothetical protein CLOSC_26960 [Clostridium saccharobutylicum]AQS00879.1 hypothetical protein CSACC_27030 [Clostridium saccharobutylicum]AQS10535.1 hypothetical protein CLOBY_26800 [Clostridium saccharobutylicum]AQS14862.1 hypothetical protein CLOSACC_27030 [Clostridium saccharobutylicum]
MKKEGSILIEVVASLMIVSLTSTFIVKANIQNYRILKERMLSEEVDRTVYNIINEFKYNVDKNEINNLLENNEVGFQYYDDFSKDLINKNISDFRRGDDIKIMKVGEDEKKLKLKIEANIKEDNNEINVEEDFTKSWWMDDAEEVC